MTSPDAAGLAGGGAPVAVVAMEGVRFAWPGKRAFSLSIDGFSLARSERMLLLGPSGGGKSTFLSLVAGIVAPQQGRIAILGTDIARLPGAARDTFRAEHLGIIFQMFNLLPYGSLIDNAVLPLSFSRGRAARVAARGGAEKEAARLLRELGIEEALIRNRVRASELSVGQQQRVAAARALIGAPELIIADEPTSALDRNRQQAFLDLLFGVLAEAGSTLMMVSHDETLGDRFSRVVRLDDIAVAGREAA